MDFPRIHKVKPASESLDNGFLDGPEQGGYLRHISIRHHRYMLKLLCMEDPVIGVFPPEFVGPCHVDADIGFIPAEGGPHFPSTLAEGDSRPPMFSPKEMGLAKRVVDHLNRKSISGGGVTAIPKGAFHRHQVIPKDGDETVSISACSVCPPFQGISMRQGCIEDRSPLIKGTQGLDAYLPIILCHIHSQPAGPATQSETQRMRIL